MGHSLLIDKPHRVLGKPPDAYILVRKLMAEVAQMSNVIARALTKGLDSPARRGNRRVSFRIYLGTGLFIAGLVITVAGLISGGM